MRFILFFSVCLFGSAMAVPSIARGCGRYTGNTGTNWGGRRLAKRDSKEANAALNRIKGCMDEVNSLFKSKPSGGSREQAARISEALFQLSRKSMEELHLSARAIRKGPAITQMEAISLASTLNQMGTPWRSIARGWTDAKDMISAAGLREEALLILVSNSEALTAFCEALFSKIPSYDQLMANTAKKVFLDILEPAIARYEK